MQCVRSMTLYGEFWCDGCYGWAVVMRAQGWMECSLWIFQIHICENNNEMWFSVESWADKYESNTNAVAHTYSTVCLYSIYTSCGSATGRAAIACVCIYNGACGSALDSLVTLQHFRHCNSQTRCVSICEMKLCACSGVWMCVCVYARHKLPQIKGKSTEFRNIWKFYVFIFGCKNFRILYEQKDGRVRVCVLACMTATLSPSTQFKFQFQCGAICCRCGGDGVGCWRNGLCIFRVLCLGLI